MLGSNYLSFNSVSIPNPKDFNIKFQNIETVRQSEAGTDLGIVTRLQKRTFNCSFDCTSTWLAQFKAMCSLTSGTLLYQSESITCRARITSQKLAKNSEFTARTEGLWTISVSFTEV